MFFCALFSLSAFPPSFLTYLHISLYVFLCAWQEQQQQRAAPVSDQLIILRLYYPGLFTILVPDYSVLYGDNSVPLLSSFLITPKYFVFQCFCFCTNALVFVGSCRNFQCHSVLLPARRSPDYLHAGSDQVCTQLTYIVSEASPSPPPAALLPVTVGIPPSSLEPFIPIPNRFSNKLGHCEQFLQQCSLVFYQQLYTYTTNRAKIAFF